MDPLNANDMLEQLLLESRAQGEPLARVEVHMEKLTGNGQPGLVAELGSSFGITVRGRCGRNTLRRLRGVNAEESKLRHDHQHGRDSSDQK